MHYHPLGQTGIDVSTIALGYWAVADPRIWGPQDEQAAIGAVHAALERGINLIDTAEGYGDGQSEILLGKALADRREQAIIATKVSRGHLAPADVVAACEASLRHLQVDYIDLYQIHWANPAVPLADTLDTLDRLREQGKIRAIGVSNFGPHDLAEGIAHTRLEANQLPYNLLFRAIEDEVIPLCQQHSISVLIYSPLLHGVLTGKFATLDDVPDERARTRHFAAERPLARHNDANREGETMAALDAIRRISDDAGLPMAQLALAWLLHQPSVTSVIAGARNPQQVEDNAAATDITLSADMLAALDAATAPLKHALGPNLDPWQSGRNSRSQ